MTQPTKNHELLQEYIDGNSFEAWVKLLKEIQSRLIKPVEYEIVRKYEFSNDGEFWTPTEVTSAIALLKKE